MSAVRKLERSEFLEEYKSIESMEKRDVLREMKKLSRRGWRVQSFGWSNGFQGGWYALMTRLVGA